MTDMTSVTEPAVQIDGHDHLSSAQVARYLQIKPETVYAYVSRGVLRRVRVPGRRESYFPLVEVEALVRPSAPTRRRAPGLTDDIRTAVTLVESDRLSYRGHDAGTLAAESTFVDVCTLLWQHPGDFAVDEQTVTVARTMIGQLPEATDVASRVRLVITTLGALDDWRDDRDPARVALAVSRMIMTSAVALSGRAQSPDSVAAAIAASGPDEVSPDRVRWLDQALILLADHDLAGSTTAVRVAASARANPYSSISAGVNAWDSPAHGTAARAAYRMLDELIALPGRAMTDRLEAPGRPPGFGHVVYTDSDPRAELLIAQLHRLSDHPALAAGERIAELLWRRRGLPRNVDLALALAAHAFGAPAGFGELVFLHARIAGWAAHVLEEYACPPLRFRLHGVYTGPRP